MDLESVDEEGRLLLAVTSGLCALFIVFSYQADTVAIIYIYLGWCIYVAIFSIRFRRRRAREQDENLGPPCNDCRLELWTREDWDRCLKRERLCFKLWDWLKTAGLDKKIFRESHAKKARN